MPRDRLRSFDEATARIGVRDRVLDRAAGNDEDDVEEPLSWSERLRREWPNWTMEKRRKGLRAELALKFRKRFGFAWDPRRASLVLDPPWPPARMPGQRSRPYEARARFVMLFDFENQLSLPARPDGSTRFLTLTELTWISLLAGNWPRAGGRRTPDAVVQAERLTIKQALKRYGQRPAEWLKAKRIRRGPQVRTRPK
jgi:hypothetical protein